MYHVHDVMLANVRQSCNDPTAEECNNSIETLIGGGRNFVTVKSQTGGGGNSVTLETVQ